MMMMNHETVGSKNDCDETLFSLKSWNAPYIPIYAKNKTKMKNLRHGM